MTLTEARNRAGEPATYRNADGGAEPVTIHVVGSRLAWVKPDPPRSRMGWWAHPSNLDPRT